MFSDLFIKSISISDQLPAHSYLNDLAVIKSLRAMGRLSYDELPLFLNAEMIAQLLGVSNSSAYELMHQEGFPAVRIGNRLIVPKADFQFWIQDEVNKERRKKPVAIRTSL